jgi:uncharacterized protein
MAESHGKPAEHLIVLQANDVETTGIEVSEELPVAWLNQHLREAEAEARGAGKFSGRLSRSGKADIVVRGKLSASVSLPCARCLTMTPVEVSAELSLLLRPRKEEPRGGRRAVPEPAKQRTPKAVEYEFSSEEAELDDYDGEKVILDGFIREAILLELPSFPLCTEDCSGISESSLRKAAGSQPGSRGGAGRVPASKSEPGKMERPNPFEALRHLLTEKPLPSDEGLGNSARPSAAEVRRATRTLQREKPKIRSSMTGRSSKKS